jgi:hypothetical protein
MLPILLTDMEITVMLTAKSMGRKQTSPRMTKRARRSTRKSLRRAKTTRTVTLTAKMEPRRQKLRIPPMTRARRRMAIL